MGDNSGNGYRYIGSLIYAKSGSALTLESARFAHGYIAPQDGQIYYHTTDHLGSVRAVTNMQGSVVERNGYYPFGSETALGSSYPKLLDNRMKFNGKEVQTTGNLGLLDYGARMYDPAIGRWTAQDPLSEKYYSFSAYNYCVNNPVMFVDLDGRAASPIYDTDGNLLGTDDNGLQGEAIIMDREDFKQGMSHSEALEKNLGVSGLSSGEARNKYETSFNSLKDRPDWDGYLTLKEANEWYRKGNGVPLYVDLNKIDLSGIISFGKYFIGQTKVFNLLLHSGNINEGLVYGQITLKRYPNHEVRAFSDKYNFEMHNWSNPFNWPRNIQTYIGERIAGSGVQYEINIYGSAKLKPILPWLK